MIAPIVTAASDPELRRTGLGGTDIARILGLSRFGGPMDVYLEKIGQAAPLIETEPMRWGKLLEPAIAEEYARKSGRVVRRGADFLRHRVYPEFFANIDRWSLLKGTPKRVLELKTTSVFTADDFGEEHTDEVPGDYLAQGMWYGFVTGAETVDLAVLIGGNKHRVYTIPRDDELVADMEERAHSFWDDTQRRIPPAIDGSDASTAYLKTTYRDKGTERAMDDELVRLAYEYRASKENIKALEERVGVIGNEIRDLMGDDRWAEGEGVKVVYGDRQAPAKTDWPALVKAQGIPESVVEEFTTRGDPIRTLTVTVKPA
jgi:putative phage-type endonuclease